MPLTPIQPSMIDQDGGLLVTPGHDVLLPCGKNKIGVRIIDYSDSAIEDVVSTFRVATLLYF